METVYATKIIHVWSHIGNRCGRTFKSDLNFETNAVEGNDVNGSKGGLGLTCEFIVEFFTQFSNLSHSSFPSPKRSFTKK